MTLLFFAAAFLAEIIGTLAGFGSSTILLPVAVLFFDFRTALVLVAFMHLFGNLGRVAFFRHGFDRKVIIYFGIISVVFTLIGAALVSTVDQDLLKGLLGAFLVVYGLFALLNPKVKISQSKSTMALGGAISGFLAGLIGTGGAVRSSFIAALNLPKARYIATAAAIALAVDLTRLPVYINQGLLSQGYLWFLPILFVLAIAGSFVGKKLVSKVPQKSFRSVVFVALAAVGVVFVVEWLR